jgi:hypothetical protein
MNIWQTIVFILSFGLIKLKAETKSIVTDRMFPAPTTVKTITSTVNIKSGDAVIPGLSYVITPQGMGDGSQDEYQSPVFRLEKGASLQRAVIGTPGCDGVHVYGDNLVKDTWWLDVGEDALTVKTRTKDSINVGTIRLTGGGARDAADKIIQINAACTLIVDGFICKQFGKVIRVNGGKKFEVTIHLKNCKFDTGEYIVLSDSPLTEVIVENCLIRNVAKPFRMPVKAKLKMINTKTM